MKALKSERKYALEHFDEVYHTTLNPDGPGVVRIHLIPPKYDGGAIGASVAIINGQDIIPVNRSWAILLAEFINAVNKYEGREVSDEDLDAINNETVAAVKKVYPFISRKHLLNDIYTMMNTFKQIAYGEEVAENVGFMTMGEYAPYMKAPHRMDLMISAMTKDGSWHCNQKCVHCYAAGQCGAEESEMSTEDWFEVLDKLRRIGVAQVTFTGGEPTMRDDLVKLVDHARWFVTRLNTNGIKLTKELCRELRDASLDSAQITFYSSDADIHNRLVGANHYEDTVNGIKNALEAGLNISINTPLCTLNKDYTKTLEFLKSLGVMYVTCSGLITTGNAEGEESESLQLSTDEIKSILKDAVDYCYSNGMEISFTSPGWVSEEFIESLSITKPSCGACLSNMAITPGGNVVPCQSWLSDEVLGSFLDDSWEAIWDSDAARERRAFSARMTGECPLRKKKGEDK